MLITAVFRGVTHIVQDMVDLSNLHRGQLISQRGSLSGAPSNPPSRMPADPPLPNAPIGDSTLTNVPIAIPTYTH